MGKYILRRLGNYVILLFIAVTLAYFLSAAALNPRSLYELANPPINPASIEASLRAYNLSDRVPLIQRWWTWFTNIVLHWDWGRGPKGAVVNDEIGRRIWVSVRLVTIGSVLGIVLGVLLGAWNATRQYKASDRVSSGASLLVLSIPVLVIATVLTIIATRINQSAGYQVFEFIGETGARGDYPLAGLVDRLQHLLLPTISLALLNIASFSRIQRNLMLDSLSSDFVRTARAKGLRRRQAVFRHALRTALIPTGTYFAFSIATLFVGATFTERIFAFHGMGEYSVTTISGEDVNGTVAVVAFSGVCVLAGAVLADIMVAILDPRVRLS